MTLDRLPRAYDRAMEIASDAIPVIDLGPFRLGGAEDRARVAAEIGRACETVGFLYVVDHGIPQDLIDAAFEQNRRFFAQPMAERMKTAATLEHWRGYVPSKLEGEGGAVGGAIETFRLMLDLPPDDAGRRGGKASAHGQQVARPPARVPGDGGAILRRRYGSGEDPAPRLRHGAGAGAGPSSSPGTASRWSSSVCLHYRPPKSGNPADLEIGAGGTPRHPVPSPS